MTSRCASLATRPELPVARAIGTRSPTQLTLGPPLCSSIHSTLNHAYLPTTGMQESKSTSAFARLTGSEKYRGQDPGFCHQHSPSSPAPPPTASSAHTGSRVTSGLAIKNPLPLPSLFLFPSVPHHPIALLPRCTHQHSHPLNEKCRRALQRKTPIAQPA